MHFFLQDFVGGLLFMQASQVWRGPFLAGTSAEGNEGIVMFLEG